MHTHAQERKRVRSAATAEADTEAGPVGEDHSLIRSKFNERMKHVKYMIHVCECIDPDCSLSYCAQASGTGSLLYLRLSH